MENNILSVGLLLTLLNALKMLYDWYHSSKKYISEEDNILNEIKTSVLKTNMKLDSQCTQLLDLQATLKSNENEIDNIKERLLVLEIKQKNKI